MSAANSADTPEAGAKNVNRVVLVSIDGWGISSEKKGNAILNAETPNMNKLEKEVTTNNDTRRRPDLPASVGAMDYTNNHVIQC